MQAARISVGAEAARQRFEALVTADKDAGGDGKWWLRHGKRWGPSRFFGVRLRDGRWGCSSRSTESGSTSAGATRRRTRRASPTSSSSLCAARRPKTSRRRLWSSYGGQRRAAVLVAAALRRVERVDVNQSDDGAEARDAAAAVEAKIAAKKDDLGVLTRFTFLSDIDVPGLEWMLDLADAGGGRHRNRQRPRAGGCG